MHKATRRAARRFGLRTFAGTTLWGYPIPLKKERMGSSCAALKSAPARASAATTDPLGVTAEEGVARIILSSA